MVQERKSLLNPVVPPSVSDSVTHPRISDLSNLPFTFIPCLKYADFCISLLFVFLGTLKIGAFYIRSNSC